MSRVPVTSLHRLTASSSTMTSDAQAGRPTFATLPEETTLDEDGPGETTLAMYSLFMAASSLVFGGLSLWHASGNDLSFTGLASVDVLLMHVEQAIDNMYRFAQFMFQLLPKLSPQALVWFSSMLCLVVLLAFATNPSDTSFRSYLTDIALHQHLHHFRQDAIDASNRRLTTFSSEELQGIASREAKQNATHVQSFATRISVCLRTPAYSRNDYGLASTVTVSEQDHYGDLLQRHYIGVFGKWWTGGVVRRRSPAVARADIGKKVNGSASGGNSFVWGISSMHARDPLPEGSSPAVRRKSDDDAQIATLQSASEKGTSGKRKKHANKGRHPNAQLVPLLPSNSSKDASTSYDVKLGGDDSIFAGGDPAASQSQMLNVDAESNPIAEKHLLSGVTVPPLHVEATQSEAISEAQAQLDQVRIASEAARKALQTQLEELRARKRDEDAARLDVKGRMKTLDEHKRQAEGMRREAERRLKAANGLKELLQNRITAKSQQILDLRRREEASKGKAEESAKNKVKILQELQEKIEEKKDEEASAQRDLAELNDRLEAMQLRLLEEEGNLQAAREMAAESYVYGGAIHHSQLPQHQQQHDLHLLQQHLQNQQQHQTAPTEFFAPQYIAQYQDAMDPGLSPMHLGGATSHALEPTYYDVSQPFNSTNVLPQPHHGPWSNNGALSDVPLAPQARPLAHVSAMFGEQSDPDGPDDAFDPTVLAPMQQTPINVGRARFSPFSYDGANMTQAELDMLSRSRMNSITPISPFSSDLLPSNLFQNADEDERHAGILPGTHSERVEAALNRFGLNTSDTSDAEATHGEDADATRSETSERQAEGQDKASIGSNGRTWWGGRARSKERTGVTPITGLTDSSSIHHSSSNEAGSEGAASIEGAPMGSMGKRRSLSIFPKLSLNPGAKSFRGSIRKTSDANNVAATTSATMSSDDLPHPDRRNNDDDLIMRQAWNASSGQLPASQHDYEMLKRAFEAHNSSNNASTTQLCSPVSKWSMLNRRDGGTLGGLGWPSAARVGDASTLSSHGGTRASSDSMAAFSSGGLRQPNNWLDDAIMPLERTTSRGSQNSTHSGVNARIGPPASKPSRFALWRNNSGLRDTRASTEDNVVPKGHDKQLSIGSSGGDDIVQESEVMTAAGELAAGEGSAPPNAKAKRASFLWSRKNDAASSNADRTTSTDSIAEASSME